MGEVSQYRNVVASGRVESLTTSTLQEARCYLVTVLASGRERASLYGADDFFLQMK